MQLVLTAEHNFSEQARYFSEQPQTYINLVRATVTGKLIIDNGFGVWLQLC